MVATVPRQGLQAEEAILAGILSGAEFDFDALNPEEFLIPLHRRLYSRLRMMNACEEPINILAVLDPMGLDVTEMQSVGALQDPLFGPFTNEHLQGHVRIVKREARHRELLKACENLLNANGDIPLRAMELQAETERYLKAANSSRATWQQTFHTVEELTEREAIHLIDSVLPEGVAFIGGLSGTGKTWFALSMSRALIKGQKFLGVFSVYEAQNVLYLVPEMGEAAFKKRCRRMSIAGPRFRCQTISDGAGLDLTNPVLLEAVRELRPVIFLDTSIRFSNAESENSAAENRALTRAIFALLREGAKAVVCLHHRGKGSAKADELTLENTLRGTTDLGAIADVVWGLKYDSLNAAYFKESQKLCRLDVRCVKARDFSAPGDLRIQLNPYLDQIGDFAVLTEEAPQQESEIDRLIRAIQENPLASKVQLQTSTGIGRNRISKLAATAGWSFKPLTGWLHG